MSKCKVYNFSMKQEAKVTITVNNCTNSTKVHDVKCTSDKYNWTALFSSQIVTVGASKVVIVVVCKNGSLHMFSPGDRGQRLFPPLQLPSQVHILLTYLLGLYVRFISFVLIGVEYRNYCQTLDVYLLFAILLRQIKSKLNYRLVTYKLASP